MLKYNTLKKGLLMNVFLAIASSSESPPNSSVRALCIKLQEFGYRAVKITVDKSKKQASAKKATETRQAATAAKIQNGLKLWRMEGDQDKELTAYKLGQLAKVSQNTAKKYLNSIKA